MIRQHEFQYGSHTKIKIYGAGEMDVIIPEASTNQVTR